MHFFFPDFFLDPPELHKSLQGDTLLMFIKHLVYLKQAYPIVIDTTILHRTNNYSFKCQETAKQRRCGSSVTLRIQA